MKVMENRRYDLSKQHTQHTSSFVGRQRKKCLRDVCRVCVSLLCLVTRVVTRGSWALALAAEWKSIESLRTPPTKGTRSKHAFESETLM
jgi:hypothetical protein